MDRPETLHQKQVRESDDQLRKMYREEGWGVLAEAAGFDPVHTKSAARAAFRFSAEHLQIVRDICEAGKPSNADRIDAILSIVRPLTNPPKDETDNWDGEGACPKCQGDDCDPEGGCVYDE
jgi:hypothetical protein